MSRALRFQNIASRLLAKFDERIVGVDSIQLEQTPSSFNPITGEYEFGTPVFFNLVGVAVSFSKEHTNAISTNGNVIQAGDQLLKIDSTVEPKINDKILLDGLKYSIVSIDPSRYTNRTILYTVHLRK